MVLLGVLGYILRKMHFPMSPLILGFVLGGNAGAEPAPRPLHQQRQHGDPVGEQRNEDPAGNGDYGDCRAAGAALDPPTPAQTAAGYRLISPLNRALTHCFNAPAGDFNPAIFQF